MSDLYDAADAIERAPRWRDVADELPHEAGSDAQWPEPVGWINRTLKELT